MYGYHLVMTNITMERSTMSKNKPSISIRATKKPWQTVSHNHFGYIILNPIKPPF